jgi:hypothetical protein
MRYAKYVATKISGCSWPIGASESVASKQNAEVTLWYVLLNGPLHFSPHNNSLWLGCNNERMPFQSC